MAVPPLALPSAPLFLLACIVLLIGCAQPGPRGKSSLLPVGFAWSLPDVPLDAYAYFSQGGQPFVFQTEIGEGRFTFPFHAQVRDVALFRGTGEETSPYGLRASFAVEEEASAMAAMIEQLQKGSPNDPRLLKLWVRQDGPRLDFVYGSGTEAEALQRSLAKGNFVSLQERSLDLWNTFALLPPVPPVSPVAAGYVDMHEGGVNGLHDLLRGPGQETLDRLGPLLRAAGVQRAAYGLYADEIPGFREGFALRDIHDTNPSVLVAMDSSLPSFLAGYVYDIFLASSGLEQVRLGKESVYIYPLEEGTALLKARGNILLLAAASRRSDAEALLRSALEVGH
ncbi:MAG: hypothetical protein HY685_02975 [Chloroflexi bacterium]|nr:hypothetical protein [Chloroflexota bacterium]